MKFFILLLSVGLVLAQEETTQSSDVDVTTNSSGRQQCNGEGRLIVRLGCTETCRRDPAEEGKSSIFTAAAVGEPCKNIWRRSGVCEVSPRAKNVGVCKVTE